MGGVYTYYIGKITSITNTALELKLYVGGLFHTDSGINVISKYYIKAVELFIANDEILRRFYFRQIVGISLFTHIIHQLCRLPTCRDYSWRYLGRCVSGGNTRRRARGDSDTCSSS